MKIIVLKKKTLFVAIAVILVAMLILGLSLGLKPKKTTLPLGQKVIVLDAGHGGIDVGVVGSLGTKESELNLIIVKELQKQLEKAGLHVVLTRENDEGLYDKKANNKKSSEMKKRKEIIRSVDAELVISIHANKFPNDKTRRGAQVFFDEFNKEGKVLASKIQSNLNVLNKEHTKRNFESLSADYFILKCCNAPSALIECGFLSNEEDEKLLLDESYRQKLVFNIFSGIVSYLDVWSGKTAVF